MTQDILSELAPRGVLRAGLNMANAFLITGTTASGEPDGVAPDMAREIAKRLGVEVSLVPFGSPGEVADAGAEGAWDIALIADEPARAEAIAFTAAYVEIEATYLVPEGSPFTAIGDVDRDGVRIAVSGRSAYDLYLTRSLQHAELVRAKGVGGAFEIFVEQKLDALAGLRPALGPCAEKLPGSRILDGRFTAVQQAIGTPRDRTAAAAYLHDFVEEAKSSGLVAELVARHGVDGSLAVAPPA